jgi:hypothetical protein
VTPLQQMMDCRSAYPGFWAEDKVEFVTSDDGLPSSTRRSRNSVRVANNSDKKSSAENRDHCTDASKRPLVLDLRENCRKLKQATTAAPLSTKRLVMMVNGDGHRFGDREGRAVQLLADVVKVVGILSLFFIATLAVMLFAGPGGVVLYILCLLLIAMFIRLVRPTGTKQGR